MSLPWCLQWIQKYLPWGLEDRILQDGSLHGKKRFVTNPNVWLVNTDKLRGRESRSQAWRCDIRPWNPHGGQSNCNSTLMCFWVFLAHASWRDHETSAAKCQVYGKSLPKELGPRRSDFNQTTGQAFSFHHGGHGCQSVPLDQPAGDTCGGSALPRGDDDPEPVVSASPHGATPRIHHKTNQEAKNQSRRLDVFWRDGRKMSQFARVILFSLYCFVFKTVSYLSMVW